MVHLLTRRAARRIKSASQGRAERAALTLRAGVGAGALRFEGHAGSAAREAAVARYEALKDEGILSFCIPTFSFIWRIPIRGINGSDE